VLSKDEAKFVFERGCEQLVLGSGQMGNVHLSPEAEAYFAKKGCTVLLQPTPAVAGRQRREPSEDCYEDRSGLRLEVSRDRVTRAQPYR
jgi:hypothetical protein